jgi:PAS domain S-box-containing protein
MLTSLPADLCGRIVACSPDAILICDPRGVVRYWNAAAERVFGFGPAEAIGASMELIIPERLRAKHWAGWKETMRTGFTHYREGQLLAVPATTKDGRRISIEFSIQLVKGADNRIEWVVAIIRDVTERYGREKAMRAEMSALKTKGYSSRRGYPSTVHQTCQDGTRVSVRRNGGFGRCLHRGDPARSLGERWRS